MSKGQTVFFEQLNKALKKTLSEMVRTKLGRNIIQIKYYYNVFLNVGKCSPLFSIRSMKQGVFIKLSYKATDCAISYGGSTITLKSRNKSEREICKNGHLFCQSITLLGHKRYIPFQQQQQVPVIYFVMTKRNIYKNMKRCHFTTYIQCSYNNKLSQNFQIVLLTIPQI